MRLKEDSSSYNASHIIKRDFRHTPQPDYPVRSQSKKPRSKFCGGKLNKPHVFHRFQSWPYRHYDQPAMDDMMAHVVMKCLNCGRRAYNYRKSRDPTIPLHIIILRDYPFWHDLPVRVS